jgi:ABC-type phosphate/phosphonate transport system substrate-binding protein
MACVAVAAPSAGAAGDDDVVFYGVALDDETRRADETLQLYLGQKIPGLNFALEDLDYEEVVEELRKSDRPYLARTTPYVYVVAEMLGADLEVLATYKSKATGHTTYHSYFVVNRREFEEHGLQPNLLGLVAYLEVQAATRTPATFVYHSRFSTSSYFLPSLFLRGQRIYATEEEAGNLIRIRSEPRGKSSTDLVKSVAEEEGVFAAVWDGTKAKFEVGGRHEAEYGDAVAFIQLPTAIPNDLLVTSTSVGEGLRTQLQQAIQGMDEGDLRAFSSTEPGGAGGDLGDFALWVDLYDARPQWAAEARAARAALRNLSRLPRRRPAPVTVQIHSENAGYREAAEQALRLSGTELVLYDETLHRHIDVVWTVEGVHKEAVVLTSEIAGHDLPQQRFHVSFIDQEDLTKRIGALVHSRMHRIRYLWPYRKSPTIMRDVAFGLPAGSPVSVRRIEWIDPEINYFRQGAQFASRVEESDFSRYELAEFAQEFGDFADPLSNVAYRVVLLRPSHESKLLLAFTAIYVVLILLAAAAAVVDWRSKEGAGATPSRQGAALAVVGG